MNLPTTPDMRPKSFWEKKEGTTGMVVSALLLAGLGWGLYKLLPFLVSILQNAVLTVVFGLILFGLIYLVTNKKIRTVTSYMFQSAMRKLTSLWATVDPIGILKNYLEDLRKSLRHMMEQITNLRGQMAGLKREIDKNEAQRLEAVELAAAARKGSQRPVMALQARRAGRLEASNRTLQELYNKMELLYRVLTKMRETAEILIEDLASEIEVKERERKMILAGHSAIRSAMSIMRGDPDKKMLFDQANEFLAEDYGRKLGEIQEFVEISRGFINSTDLQNGIYEERALQMIEEWERKPESILLGASEKQALIAASNNPVMEIDLMTMPEVDKVPVRREVPQTGRYDDLIG